MVLTMLYCMHCTHCMIVDQQIQLSKCNFSVLQMQIQMYKYCMFYTPCMIVDQPTLNLQMSILLSLALWPKTSVLLIIDFCFSLKSVHLIWNEIHHFFLELCCHFLTCCCVWQRTTELETSICPSQQCPKICCQCRVQSVVASQSVIALHAQIIVLLPLALFGGKSHARSDKWTKKYWMIRKKAQEPARDSLWGVISWSISYGWPNFPFETEHEEGW